ncbi:MAG: hypothetical protein J7J61_10390 [Candidatus Hydrothermae bacterium]|nr:hypothetical protein [Candidatus Hydrothermae bacterium]
MIKVLVINGSPRMEKGYTALLLDPFIQGEGSWSRSGIILRPQNGDRTLYWRNVLLV